MIKPVLFPIKELQYMRHYPKELYYIGNEKLLEKTKISIVGTRNPFYSTKLLTQTLAKRLSQAGICVLSGGAIGVDAIAHEAAGVENTIMISPSGLDIYYPAINRILIRNIQEKGLALSMYANDFKATPWSFVARNEMVVALGDVLVVSQADCNSGSLHSVEFALKMGKKVYVFPHRLGESEGTNNLLKNGLAEAIYDIDDFVNQFAPVEKISQTKDEFIEYCTHNPTYDEALEKYQSLVYEYELEGKIAIQNGKILPLTPH